MTISKNKTVTIAISVIMMAAMTISIALPSANAQIGDTLKTYPFIDVTPNPVGVGEQALVRFGISQQLGRVDFGWEGLTVTIETPSEHTITLDNNGDGYKTDSTGGTATVWVPEEVGTYRLRLNFPEQENPYEYRDAERGVTFPEGTVLLESQSEWIELVVTEEPNVPYPDQPLPAEYWTRPIDPQLRIWNVVAGNWRERPRNNVAEAAYDAPETAHVLWTTEITTGGLTGGLWTDVPASSETGDAYEGKFPGAIVLNGILYWQTGGSRGEPANNTYTVATDLHTGEELWRTNELSFSFGQILYFNSYNYDGVFTYLVQSSGGAYNFYDPYTGNWEFTFTDIPSGIRMWGPSGEILVLHIDYTNKWMALWNSTASGFARLGTASPDYGSWGNTVHGRTQSITELGELCYSWNVTLDGDYAMLSSFGAPTGAVYLDDGYVVGLTYNQTGVRTWSIDFDGDEKYDRWWNAPDEWEAGSNTLHWGGATDEYEDGVVFIFNKEFRQFYAFSTETGEYLWVTDSEHYLDWYGWGNVEHTWYCYEGRLYSTGVGGIVYAYNLTTGETDWTYELTDPYNEPVTGLRWWGWITMIADGKIYVGTCEHSAEQPLPRGAPLVCLDSETGEVIFRVNGMYRATRWGGNAVMGDSIYATMDTYDQRVYAVGKGPSATTICCNDNVVGLGEQVIVSGYVTDISPGTEDYGLTARFPNGVPAVHDDNMSDWMLYIYKQFAKPADIMGVDVTITLVDPNGNTPEVGTVTADADGFFKLMFEPEVPGEYTIVATFCGSDAYYGSVAKTAVGVVDVPTTPPPTETPGDPTGTIVTGFGIGIIIAVVVIGLVIIMMLRRR